MGVLTQLRDWVRRVFDPEPPRVGLPRPATVPFPAPAVGSEAPTVPTARTGVPAETGSRAAPASGTGTGSAAAPIATGASRRARIHAAFDTAMPVESRAGLAGRAGELDRLVEAVLEHGKHGIVFGARGSGKTSLSRVFGDLADEAGATVLYNLAGGDLDFADLCRPYLTELAAIPGEGLRQADIAPLMTAPFDARRVAGLLAERVRRPTILVLDEFDRIQSPATKSELSALMKLLADMRSGVRIVAVGIAANLEDLIEGHPSLRRHIVAVPVGGIVADQLKGLLLRCCEQAGLTVDDAAATEVAKLAQGSPYHLRLFGLNCALAADRAGLTHIDRTVVRQGLADAWAEWRALSARSAALVADAARRPAPVPLATAVICLAAATRTRVDRGDVLSVLEDGNPNGPANAQAVDAALAALGPILHPSAVEGSWYFDDALAPQFYLLVYNGVIDPASLHPDASDDLRTVLARGVRDL